MSHYLHILHAERERLEGVLERLARERKSIAEEASRNESGTCATEAALGEINEALSGVEVATS